MRLYLRLLIYFGAFNYCMLSSQNLILNEGFEEHRRCPGEKGTSIYSNISDCRNWFNPTHASPDYFNRCAIDGLYKIPSNYCGNQEPLSGDAYVGLGLFPSEGYSEYVSTKLKEKILPEKKYCFLLHACLPNKAYLATNEIDFALTKEKIKSSSKSLFANIRHVALTSENMLNQKGKWITLNGIIDGSKYEGCTYLTIGWFNLENRMFNLKKAIKHNLYEIYYYIDDVSLFEIKDSAKCSCDESKTEAAKDSVKIEFVKSYYDSTSVNALELRNITFENGKSTLLSDSFYELDKLVSYMKTHFNAALELYGYTDNSGREKDNESLSESRVKTVANYLIQHGVEPNRITYRGLGSKNPLVPNDTEVNRAKNRRVEFRIVLLR
ncbi:MAG: OmpA family protein [Bacteroidetes bacterium]|nr:OmpA family protein [Bacteroidota bacterium]